MTVTAPQPDLIDLREDASASLAEVAESIGRTHAGPAARDVDRLARFPVEAIDALRDARMLSASVPVEFGGMGATLTEVAGAVQVLGRHCGSTALIYAMHDIQVRVLTRHGHTPALRELLREVARSQLLLASATTEIGTGGDTRTSICSIEPVDGRITLRKAAPVISYGTHADVILATARRAPDSTPGDQVIVALPRDSFELERTSVWDTLGFRGTCSDGFVLTAETDASHVFPDPFVEVSSDTMVPVTHVLWASVWLGIAERGVSTARASLRAEARRNRSAAPVEALRVAELVGSLEQLRSLVHGAVRDYEHEFDHPGALRTFAFAIRMNGLKTSASTLAADIVNRAMQVCGISGYSETSTYSLGLQVRDMAGAALMIHNDRILANTAQMLLVAKGN